MWRAIAVFLLLFLGDAVDPGTGFAAAISQVAAKTKPADPLQSLQPMKVVIVRDARANCAPNCADWIAAQGDIVRDTPAAFQKAFKLLGKRKLPVFVNSNGGSVEAAIAIGRLIRARGLDVAVTRSDILPSNPPCNKACPNGAPASPFLGVPNSGSAVCASSCSLLLAGGVRRVAPEYTHVGVHQIIAFRTLVRVKRTFRITKRVNAGVSVVVSKTLIKEKTISRKTLRTAVTDRNYLPIISFLKDMDVEQSLIPMMQGTPNSSIHWMTGDELQSTNLTTDVAGGELLLTAMVPGNIVVGADNGKPVTVQIEASVDQGGKTVKLSLLPLSSGANLLTAKASATIRLPGGKDVLAVNPQDQLASGPLQATVANADVCRLKKQGRTSVRFDLEIDGHPVHLRSTVDLGHQEPISAILKTICGAKA